MNRRRACMALAGFAGALGAAACVPGPIAAHPAPAALLIGGASAMHPLVTALAQAFMREHGGLAVVVERGGSLPAYIAASRGAIDVAAMTRALADGEDDAGARQYLVARGDIRIVIQRKLRVAGLTRAQVRALLTGEIGNWRAIGAPDLPVTVYALARGATARQSAEQVVLDGGDFSVDARECANDAALLAAAAADPGAIACIDGSARVRALAGAGQLMAAAVDGMDATQATVLSGRYPFTSSFHLLLHGAPGGARDAFVRFARSAAGQAIVAGHDLFPVC